MKNRLLSQCANVFNPKAFVLAKLVTIVCLSSNRLGGLDLDKAMILTISCSGNQQIVCDDKTSTGSSQSHLDVHRLCTTRPYFCWWNDETGYAIYITKIICVSVR